MDTVFLKDVFHPLFVIGIEHIFANEMIKIQFSHFHIFFKEMELCIIYTIMFLPLRLIYTFFEIVTYLPVFFS